MSEVAINWNQFIEAQTKLDNYIFKIKNLNYLLTNKKRKLALIVELYELVNETKAFKFWSSKEANKEKLLLEYIDIFHFTLSLSIDYGIKLPQLPFPEENIKTKEELLDFFMDLQKNIHSLIEKDNFLQWFHIFINLGSYLGFTYEAIEIAYFHKFNINFERQQQNY